MDASLVFLDTPINSREELFETMGSWLCEHGYVKDSYQKAVLEREIQYPTGLRIPGHELAIPHTECEHIRQGGLVFVRPKAPLDFQEMCSGEPVQAEMVFLLLVKNKQDQMPLLMTLMEHFNDQSLMDRLAKEERPETIARLLDSCLKGESLCH